MKTGASFDRCNSRQDYSTPTDFIKAVETRFGMINWDLAASKENTKGQCWFDVSQDSLSQDWGRLKGNLWLNPPFKNVKPWARKCFLHSQNSSKILFLVPASVGSNWFRDYVFQSSLVLFLSPRLSFDGIAPYPKDCMLAVYGVGRQIECWKWK
jgi:site-specific DNA-methyltransferase (adenine-specific)